MTPADTRRFSLSRLELGALKGLLAIAVILLASNVPAATFPDLYAIVVPREAAAPSQGPARTQDETLRFAMGQLLTRVTGRRDAAFEPALGGMLENAREFLEQIGTLDRDNLIVRFNASNVESALVRLEQPVWGAERPLTLVWLGVDAGLGQRELLSAEARAGAPESELLRTLAALRSELATVADERGLLLTLPLLDIEDMATLSFADVWGGFRDRVERASERYAADDILIGQVRLTGFGPVARWTLIKGGRELGLPGQSLREGLDALADLYAAEFSTIGRASATVVTITGVRTLEDYGRVMRYMESLSMLGSVMPEGLADGALQLRVAARGGEAGLRRILGLGGLLRPAAGTDTLTFTLDP